MVLLGKAHPPRCDEGSSPDDQGALEWDSAMVFTSQVNNAVLEGANSLVQAAKAKARGYRNKRTFIDMISYSGPHLEDQSISVSASRS